MDATRLAHELELLRARYPDLEYLDRDGHWVRIPRYPVPVGWSDTAVEVAFRIPPEPATAPYAFYVRPPLLLASGAIPSNYTPTATTPWGAGFAQFSWSPLDAWIPKADVAAGANMLNFAASFADRLAERS
jgi:hypothetical protein